MTAAEFDCDLIRLTTGSPGVPAGLAVIVKAAGGSLVELNLYRSLDQAAAAQAALPRGALLRPDRSPLPELRQQLSEYFAGARRAFTLPLAPAGTEFERRVWQELGAIPYGKNLGCAAAAVLGRQV